MIQLEKVSKKYGNGSKKVTALDNINLQIEKGEFVVVQGPSGSGKTTLLMTIGGMLRPSGGKVTFDQNDIYSLTRKKRAKFRAENVGFVFQMFHLLPYLTCTENILLPAGAGITKINRAEALALVNRFNLRERSDHKPLELSVGEQQRTAIARAVFNNPKIILADEPTGNLDPENASEIFKYLADFHRNQGTVIVVTHGTQADRFADKIIHLNKGRIE
jgi:ABC-type lipoprotein export system ATPase subunit